MRPAVATDLESVVVEILEAELLADVHRPSLALKADGFCLGRVLAVRSQLQLDANIARREEIRVEHYHWSRSIQILCSDWWNLAMLAPRSMP